MSPLCPSCGRATEGTPFCVRCGAHISPAEPDVPVARPGATTHWGSVEGSPGIKPIVTAVVSAVAAFAVGVAVFVAIRHERHPATVAESTATPRDPLADPLGFPPDRAPAAQAAMGVSDDASRSGLSFVGQWNVHDAMIDIRGDDTATLTVSETCPKEFPERWLACEEVAEVRWVLDGAIFRGTIETVHLVRRDTNVAVEPDDPNRLDAVGNQFELRPEAPGLLTTHWTRGGTQWDGGNSYWCGDGISPDDRLKCGA
jgi:hypothetical protein